MQHLKDGIDGGEELVSVRYCRRERGQCVRDRVGSFQHFLRDADGLEAGTNIYRPGYRSLTSAFEQRSARRRVRSGAPQSRKDGAHFTKKVAKSFEHGDSSLFFGFGFEQALYVV